MADEDKTALSVDSDNQQIRIRARRQRILDRAEKARREAAGETVRDTPEDLEAQRERNRMSRIQVDKSKQQLNKLWQDGCSMVSDIRTAGDGRELIRRNEELEAIRTRNERVEAEATAAAERFDEITKKWESTLTKKLPGDLKELLTQQKQACDAMLEEKEKLLTEFQQELKAHDDRYVKDLKRQAEDIDTMLERMEEQVKDLVRSYRMEIEQIETSFKSERDQLVDEQRREWEAAMAKRRKLEEDQLKARQKRIDECDEHLKHMHIMDAEDMNKLKIEMEGNVQLLVQQIEAMRATFQLNNEKLEYNLQVLRKRDEENSATRSQQKRKILRLQDQVNQQRVRLDRLKQQALEENKALEEDYDRITQQFHDLQKKSRHFQVTDASKFIEVWKMNEERARQLAGKVIKADQIIHEQHLGLPWSEPEKIESPLITETGEVLRSGTKSASDIAKEVITTASSSISSLRIGPSALPQIPSSKHSLDSGLPRSSKTADSGHQQGKLMSQTRETRPQLPTVILRQILELIAKEADYLVEPKLKNLLSSLDEEEQLLMKLDSIFKALNIDTEDQLQELAEFFLVSAPLPEVQTRPSTLSPEKQSAVSLASKGTIDTFDSVGFGGIDTSRRQSLEWPSSPERPTSSSFALEPVNDGGRDVYAIVEPTEVHTVLRKFVEERLKAAAPSRASRALTLNLRKPKTRNIREDERFWQRLANIFPNEKERLWDALLDGLNKHLIVLQDRHKLIQETAALKHQNAELAVLLKHYLQSPNNIALHVPPTQTMQLESLTSQQ